MNKFICIHAHFYQPARENPWTKVIEDQESATPYSNWNKRIAAECYAPNGNSKVIKSNGQDEVRVNNYEQISFNFGPTLLGWLKEMEPVTYQKIIDADQVSIKNFSGHGNAMAQGYHHIILPLADDEDKKTQIYWGIKDFEHHFNRQPEGLWLPETAVDMRTLEILVEHGIKFVILAPNQAKSVRMKGEQWKGVDANTLFTQIPYQCQLNNGKSIAIFFYNGFIANEIAFGKLLKSADMMSDRLYKEFDENIDKPRLVHFATDGESYGHHHKFGDMALSYCLKNINDHNFAQITNYGEYLEKNAVDHEVQIVENSSWSCFHGVDRWQSDCGCALKENENWNQKWRKDLRGALDWLRDAVRQECVKECGSIQVLYKARNYYIDYLLDASDDNKKAFLKNNFDEVDEVKAARLMTVFEIQELLMAMYTSCGWFFDDISGIETQQILKYASKVIELSKNLWGIDFEEQLLLKLKLAKSNVDQYGDGAVVYQHAIQEHIKTS